jgi:hypothetical protein
MGNCFRLTASLGSHVLCLYLGWYSRKSDISLTTTAVMKILITAVIIITVLLLISISLKNKHVPSHFCKERLVPGPVCA